MKLLLVVSILRLARTTLLSCRGLSGFRITQKKTETERKGRKSQGPAAGGVARLLIYPKCTLEEGGRAEEQGPKGRVRKKGKKNIEDDSAHNNLEVHIRSCTSTT